MLSTSSPVADDTPVPHDWKQGVLRIVGITLHLKVPQPNEFLEICFIFYKNQTNFSILTGLSLSSKPDFSLYPRTFLLRG